MFRWKKVANFFLLRAGRNYYPPVKLGNRFWRWNFASKIVPCLSVSFGFAFLLKHLSCRLTLGYSWAYWKCIKNEMKACVLLRGFSSHAMHIGDVVLFHTSPAHMGIDYGRKPAEGCSRTRMTTQVLLFADLESFSPQPPWAFCSVESLEYFRRTSKVPWSNTAAAIRIFCETSWSWAAGIEVKST